MTSNKNDTDSDNEERNYFFISNLIKNLWSNALSFN